MHTCVNYLRARTFVCIRVHSRYIHVDPSGSMCINGASTCIHSAFRSIHVHSHAFTCYSSASLRIYVDSCALMCIHVHSCAFLCIYAAFTCILVHMSQPVSKFILPCASMRIHVCFRVHSCAFVCTHVHQLCIHMTSLHVRPVRLGKDKPRVYGECCIRMQASPLGLRMVFLHVPSVCI